METTPPFLAWAIEQPCSLRQIDGWTEPERTERHLRGIVEFANGCRAGRVIDGICLGADCLDEAKSLQEWTGFPVEEALAMFGGEALVREACGECPANGASGTTFQPLAGCHGLLPIAKLEQWTDDARLRWFGWCASSPWIPTDAERLAIFALLAGQAFETSEQDAITHFLAALTRCEQHALPLHVRMYPAGKIVGRRWVLPQHCVACGATWSSASDCRYCGNAIPTGGELRRHVRGLRPYVPLTKFMTAEDAEQVVATLRQGRREQVDAVRERYQQMRPSGES